MCTSVSLHYLGFAKLCESVWFFVVGCLFQNWEFPAKYFFTCFLQFSFYLLSFQDSNYMNVRCFVIVIQVVDGPSYFFLSLSLLSSSGQFFWPVSKVIDFIFCHLYYVIVPIQGTIRYFVVVVFKFILNFIYNILLLYFSFCSFL